MIESIGDILRLADLVRGLPPETRAEIVFDRLLVNIDGKVSWITLADTTTSKGSGDD
jgi:hypothetical protein